MKIVNDYLEIEKARFGARLRYSIEVPDEFQKAEVPPFALQILVENSVKYAVAPRREGGELRVTARRKGGSIELEVSDDGPGFDGQALPSGHGLDTLRSRLETLFGAAARLEVTRPSAGALVRVCLP